jgi:trimethylamine:corrinoid methyltransferase-like protein
MSPEKLVMDAEAIGLLKHWKKGLLFEEGSLAVDVIDKVGPGGSFISERHTLNYFRKEYNYDCQVMNFMDRVPWTKAGSPDMLAKAAAKVDEILAGPGVFLDEAREAALNEAFRGICKEVGITDVETLIGLSRG